MKASFIISLGICLVCCLLGSTDGKSVIVTHEREQECEPGKPFKLGCNHCWCNKNGAIAFCTLEKCSYDRDPYTSSRCVPNSVFKIDCNTCRCGSDGVVKACTRKACQHSDERCTPGESFPYDCNTCVCGPDGQKSHAACTLMACGGSTWPINENNDSSDSSSSSSSSDSSSSSSSSSSN